MSTCLAAATVAHTGTRRPLDCSSTESQRLLRCALSAEAVSLPDHMRRTALASAAAFAAFALSCLPPAGFGQAASYPGREVLLPPAEVKDTFFSWLVGIIYAGLDVELDSATLRSVLVEFRSNVDLPFNRITDVRHEAPRSTQGALAITFDGPMRVPVPFAILWYHPGSIRSTAVVRFSEERLEAASAGGATFGPVYAFRLVQGDVQFDIDEWLDVLLGDLIDDVSVHLVAIVRWQGTWRGLLGGANRAGRRYVAAFDFARNVIQFPVPRELSRLGLALWNAQGP